MKRFRSVSFPLTAAIGVVASLLLAGCSDDPKTSAQFAASATAPAPGLVKLEAKAISGSRVVVDVLLYGPEPDLDLNRFEFGIEIGNPALVRFVPQASYVQTALVADDGQAIAIDVDGASDPSLVAVVVEKQGGGAGNGFESESVIVIELAFEVQGSGVSSLSIIGLGANPPQALDSELTLIRAVTFDEKSAGLSIQTTDGGY